MNSTVSASSNRVCKSVRTQCDPAVSTPSLPVRIQRKLAILADAAKYDASCASSGAEPRNSMAGRGIGSTEGAGICHSYAPDGRCISLLKILLTNFCVYDCQYCVNRVSSNVQRARFSIEEVVMLTLSFYRRNYIEGLFLSSGIVQSPDYTMEQIVEVARQLREEHDFRGYIHLKTIPEASCELLAAAGRHADRLSINVELARAQSLAELAPQKDATGIRRSMAAIRSRLDESTDRSLRGSTPPRFASAGQSTQMIVGADASSDAELLECSRSLYGSYKLKRVYYSAFSPIPQASQRLPQSPPNLHREHRLYQADWLMRFYGFSVEDIVRGRPRGMLDLSVDPKLAWALDNRAFFPLDVNRADRDALLRVPGLGARSVDRLLAARRHGALRVVDLQRLSRAVKRMLPFVIARDWAPTRLLDRERLAAELRQANAQLDMFDERSG